MFTYLRSHKHILLIIAVLLITFIPLSVVFAWDEHNPCPSGTGPGGITAGDYDPNTLTQDQKQWLFTIFGNAGIAPVGYGGSRCGVPYPTNTPVPPPPPPADTQVPPPPPPPPANTPVPTTAPLPTLRPCPSGTGPGGIIAGDYDPTKLAQDQRQWLFTIFGNAGQASVGYGGQRCGSGVSLPPPCPQGTGPNGIPAGSYDPTKLTQPQRQWLFEIFGHTGTASVGYGGEYCSGGTSSSYTPGSTGSATTGGNTTQPCPSGTGPDNIPAGSYDPTKLTQPQHQWLFQIFGHIGTAPVGYGGENCTGNPPYTPGVSSTTGTTSATGTTGTTSTTNTTGAPTSSNVSGPTSSVNNPSGSNPSTSPQENSVNNPNNPTVWQVVTNPDTYEPIGHAIDLAPLQTGYPLVDVGVPGVVSIAQSVAKFYQYINTGDQNYAYESALDWGLTGLTAAAGLISAGATAPVWVGPVILYGVIILCGLKFVVLK